MKFKYVLLIQIFILFGFSCKSYKTEMFEGKSSKKYILLDNNFVNIIGNEIKKSRRLSIEKEKKEFINRKIDNIEYLKKLNDDYYLKTNEHFIQTKFADLVNSKLNSKKVKNIYFINILLNEEKTSIYNFVLSEGLDYIDELFYYGDISEKVSYKEIDDELIDFTHEFMLNLPYSFENKTFFNNNIQYFTIDRVSATGKNKYEIQSVIVPKMLNYQIQIFEKLYGLKIK